MGLAVRVSTSTPSAMALIDSLWLTPKRCSSSTTSRPSFLKVTSSPSSRWVPTTTSTEPSASPASTSPGLGVGQEPAEQLHLDREAGEAVGEGLGVLAGQQGGGHQHGGLVAVLDRLEDGPDGHLGLAEADVAADQPVHGLGPLHVGLDLLDGLQLVGGLDEGERRLQLGLPRGVGTEGVAGHLAAAAGTGRRAPRRSRGPRPGPWTGPSATPTRPAG